MSVLVGKPAPDAIVEYWLRGSKKPAKMSIADHRGKWVVLFFYPRDFTFVCPTEIAEFARLQEGFDREEAVIIAASTDSYFSHDAWFQQDERLATANFPVIADTAHKLSDAYGMLLPDGSALRGTFIIDPEGIVRHMTVNEIDVGRNVVETLRVLQALQSGELCQVGWSPGQETYQVYKQWLDKIFPRLRTSILSEASQRLNTQLYEPGDIIIQQGAVADKFFILVSGYVSVIHRGSHGKEVELSKLGPGDVFGELGILTETRRTADVRAESDVSVLALDWEDFKSLVNKSDPTANDFMKIVEQRRNATAQLTESSNG